MNQKGLSTLIIIILVALAIGGAYYLGMKKVPTLSDVVSKQNPVILPKSSSEPANKPTPDSAPTDIFNLKIYTNNAYNFSFKYPQDWTIGMDQPNTIYVQSPKNFALIIRYKVKGDSMNIVRSGVGAGDLVTRGTVKFGTKVINKDVLVFQNQDKGILYDKSAEIPVDNLVFSLSVDNLQSAAVGYPTLDQQTEDQADQILSTFKSTN